MPADDGLRILLYHRVADDGDPLAVPPARFREQMGFLAAAGYRVVGSARGARRCSTAGSRAAADDRAHASTTASPTCATHALPVLERQGFRATVFVTTGVTDGRHTFPWYDRQPPVLGWDDVVGARSRRDAAVRGAHGHAPSLLALDEGPARAEIRDSRRELEARLGRAGVGVRLPRGPLRRARAAARRRGGLRRRGVMRAGCQRAGHRSASRCGGGRSSARPRCSTSARRSAAGTTRRCRSAASTGGCATAWAGAAGARSSRA